MVLIPQEMKDILYLSHARDEEIRESISMMNKVISHFESEHVYRSGLLDVIRPLAEHLFLKHIPKGIYKDGDGTFSVIEGEGLQWRAYRRHSFHNITYLSFQGYKDQSYKSFIWLMKEREPKLIELFEKLEALLKEINEISRPKKEIIFSRNVVRFSEILTYYDSRIKTIQSKEFKIGVTAATSRYYKGDDPEYKYENLRTPYDSEERLLLADDEYYYAVKSLCEEVDSFLREEKEMIDMKVREMMNLIEQSEYGPICVAFKV